MTDFPQIAHSVRQPWAWAIIAGHKKIENRSAGSIRAGRMECRRIAIHAATGLKRDEFDWGVWRLQQHGVACPRPDALVRGAIIGAVDVVGIVSESDSPWFGGPDGAGLGECRRLRSRTQCWRLGLFRVGAGSGLCTGEALDDPMGRWGDHAFWEPGTGVARCAKEALWFR